MAYVFEGCNNLLYSKSIFVICDFKFFPKMLLKQLIFGALSVSKLFYVYCKGKTPLCLSVVFIAAWRNRIDPWALLVDLPSGCWLLIGWFRIIKAIFVCFASGLYCGIFKWVLFFISELMRFIFVLHWVMWVVDQFLRIVFTGKYPFIFLLISIFFPLCTVVSSPYCGAILPII